MSSSKTTSAEEEEETEGAEKPGVGGIIGAIGAITSLLNITVTITNTGGVAGYEIAQLYLSIPDSPIRQLRGFEKVWLEVGEAKRVCFKVARRDVSVWDTFAQQWRVSRGVFGVEVGASSRILG